MVPVDVEQDRDLGREVKELGPRVEGGGGVLVALEDEFPARSPARRGPEVPRRRPQAKAGVALRLAQDVGDQGGGGGLPVRPADRDPQAVPGELAPELGLAYDAQAHAPGGRGLDIVLAHLVSLYHQVGPTPARQVLLRVPVDPGDPGGGQEICRRRIGFLVRSRHLVAQLLRHQGQAGDGRAADADEVDPHQGRATFRRSETTASAACGRPSRRMAWIIAR